MMYRLIKTSAVLLALLTLVPSIAEAQFSARDTQWADLIRSLPANITSRLGAHGRFTSGDHDIDLIFARYHASFLLPEDQIASAAASAASYMASLNSNGSWPDIDYTDKARAAYEPQPESEPELDA